MRTNVLIFLLILLIGCADYPVYSDIPRVEYLTSYISEDASDKKIDITFTLYDGDGNIGLGAGDTSWPYVDSLLQNFHAKIFVKENGVFLEKPYNFSYRIPRLREEGQTKFIKAKVSVNLALAKSVFPYDTLFFTYFVYDRAFNKSNIDTSDLIIF